MVGRVTVFSHWESWWKVNTGVCLADTEVALRHPGVLGFGM
jgi:hypothetical protein